MGKIDFSRLFGVFSRRSEAPPEAVKPLTPEFRYRVLQLCQDTFCGYGARLDFWAEIHEQLRYLIGRHVLAYQTSASDDTTVFLSECDDKHFLDFIELACQSEAAFIDERQFVEDINRFFREDDLPYSLTHFIRRKEGRMSRIASYPQVIRRDDELLHETAIEPALDFLANPVFLSANEEFLAALKDYREGRFHDSVAKCASSFESVMKIVSTQKNWPYQETDTAETLLNGVLGNTDLEPFFKQPLMLVATIRNRLSSAHGAGIQQRVLSEHVAKYTVNATAAAILLLVEETRLE